MSQGLLDERTSSQIRKDNKQNEDARLRLVKELLYAPVIWRRLGTGFRIQDIKERDFSDVLGVIRDCYITEDVLCKISGMTYDELSTASFLDQCLFQLKDNVSIMAVDEITEEIAGVLLLRVVDKYDFGRVISRTCLVEGLAQQQCVDIKTGLNRKDDIYAEFDCEVFLRIYAVCVKPRYRQRRIGFAMMKCTPDICRALHVPVMMGIFSGYSVQNCGIMIGMRVLQEIYYINWVDKDKNLVFADSSPGNDTCALLAGEVLPELPPVKEPEPIEEVVEKPAKGGKKDAKKKK